MRSINYINILGIIISIWSHSLTMDIAECCAEKESKEITYNARLIKYAIKLCCNKTDAYYTRFFGHQFQSIRGKGNCPCGNEKASEQIITQLHNQLQESGFLSQLGGSLPERSDNENNQYTTANIEFSYSFLWDDTGQKKTYNSLVKPTNKNELSCDESKYIKSIAEYGLRACKPRKTVRTNIEKDVTVKFVIWIDLLLIPK